MATIHKLVIVTDIFIIYLNIVVWNFIKHFGYTIIFYALENNEI